MRIICPYCNFADADSKEHIFPQFLGGKSTILACKKCNNEFGHTFEGAVNKNLNGIASILAFCGLKLPNDRIWKNAFTTNEGRSLDFYTSNGRLRPSKLTRMERADGFTMWGTEKATLAAARDYKKKFPDAKIKITPTSEKFFPPKEFQVSFDFKSDLKRLCIKMCLALIAHFRPELSVADDSTLAMLLGNQINVDCVRIAYLVYKPLCSMRTPLSHSIYVQGTKKGVYGVVQLFGFFQLYVVINRNYSAAPFSFFANLSPPDWTETIKEVEFFRLAEAPTSLMTGQLEFRKRAMLDSLNDQVKELFGFNRCIF